jgi:hypothetical protein
MTLTNAIKAIEKKGYKVEAVGSKTYRVDLGKTVLEFFNNGCTITCIAVRRSNDFSDSMTDYCAWSFYPNLTQALKYNA